MSKSPINRRAWLTLAGTAGLGGAFTAPNAQAGGQQKGTPEAPSPSDSVPRGSLELDTELRKEILAKLRSGRVRLPQEAAEAVKIEDLIQFVEKGGRESPMGQRAPGGISPETIVRLFGRPVLFVQNSSFQTVGLQSATLRKQLEQHRARLEGAIPAIGRIELAGHPDYTWVGTGWLVAEDVAVTNRHVAELFARRGDGEIQFRRGVGGKPVQARIDFLQEHAPLPEEREFRVLRVLHIEPENGYDLALLKVSKTTNLGDMLSRPIGLFGGKVERGRPIAVIGYPAYDSRIPDPAAMQRIYGGVYDIKRLAPGVVMSAGTNEVQHDCSTLGGNSGSALVDMETGQAVGLHWGGTYLTANYAVPARVIADRLAKHKG